MLTRSPFPSQHEMIHAFLFLTKRDRDRDGHGPDFRAHMKRINDAAGTSITVYHSFHQEVEVHRGHWWKCNVRAPGGPMWQHVASSLLLSRSGEGPLQLVAVLHMMRRDVV